MNSILVKFAVRGSPATGAAALVAAFLAAMLDTMSPAAAQQDPVEIPIGYVRQLVVLPPNLSNLIPPPEDEGAAGGRLSIRDNNTTGRFMGQTFTFRELDVPPGEDVLPRFMEMVDDGIQFFVLNVAADVLLKVSDAVADRDVLLFNSAATDDRLRDADCRANVMHIVPSRSMYTDALAQYLMWKRWARWFLVVGQREGDKLFAEAVRKSAKKFGAKLVEDKVWEFGEDARRIAQAEVPGFTQAEDYDILVVADEIGVFGEYLLYRTFDPRPVAGTQGLSPSTWHLHHEQWGSAQLQSRFEKTNQRRMTALDYQVWAPIRAIGEAATRTRSGAFDKIAGYLRSPEFELAGFKGVPLTFRSWNQQLRQPILLAHPAALVSVSPQEGYLHQRSVLDTMGLDEREVSCSLGN